MCVERGSSDHLTLYILIYKTTRAVIVLIRDLVTMSYRYMDLCIYLYVYITEV